MLLYLDISAEIRYRFWPGENEIGEGSGRGVAPLEGVVMSAITMAGLSASDAEEALVQVWLLLEEHRVASPEVAVKSLSDHVQIRFCFTLKEDADLVRSKLEDWAGKRGLRVH